MQSQCAQTTAPSFFAATQGFNFFSFRAWECMTPAVKIVISEFVTRCFTVPIQPDLNWLWASEAFLLFMDSLV